MTCKYGGANQAAVPTGHGKRRRDPLRSLARLQRRMEGTEEGVRYTPMQQCICKLDLRTCVARAVAMRAYIFNGCTLIALCLPIPHSTLHLHVHPHSLHPFRARNSPLLACAAPRRAAPRRRAFDFNQFTSGTYYSWFTLEIPRKPTFGASSDAAISENCVYVERYGNADFPRLACPVNVV